MSGFREASQSFGERFALHIRQRDSEPIARSRIVEARIAKDHRAIGCAFGEVGAGPEEEGLHPRIPVAD